MRPAIPEDLLQVSADRMAEIPGTMGHWLRIYCTIRGITEETLRKEFNLYPREWNILRLCSCPAPRTTEHARGLLAVSDYVPVSWQTLRAINKAIEDHVEDVLKRSVQFMEENSPLRTDNE